MSPVYIARTREVAARALGGEMMIMSARDSTLFNLNETASAIWQAADGSTPLADIVERVVCAEFDVVPEEAMKDAEDFVRDLAAHGILLVSDQPILQDSK
jgi:Coenzyme PQQ synthesis protein D (PqqD)